MKRAFPRDGAPRPPQINRQTALLLVAGVGVLWGLSGIFQVGASDRGVITTFGKYDRVVGPGLHWHIPYPFQAAVAEKVTELRETLVPAGGSQRGSSAGLMLTGDKNIVDVVIRAQWQISPETAAPAGQLPPVARYRLLIDNPENLVLAIAEAAIREVVGRNELDFIQTEGRGVVMEQTRELMQQALDAQNTGVIITSVNLEKAEPPTEEVNQAFLDVIAATQDREQYINRAREYANKVVPEARGAAQQILEEARAYQAQVTADARGQASRFDAIYGEYAKAPEVTRQRMYLETVERVLGPMNKIIIEEGGQGVVPYLPLNELNKKAPQ
ncbi:MAG: FtsH protease activity modulator HflK [Parvularculaceae bacterium]|nr:FtsH protease activity modulator HflK [Parvularculaceae bacterium]